VFSPHHTAPAGLLLAAVNPLAAAAISLLVLAIPVALAAWSRQRALAAPPGNVSAAWFGYARGAQWLAIAAWLSWVAAFSLTGIDRALATWLRPAGSLLMAMGLWVFTVLPPSLSSLSIQAITHDVQRRIRGTEQTVSEHVRSAAWQLAALLVPLTLLALAALALLIGHAALAAVSGVGALLSRMWLLRRYTEVNGFAPQAITTGPLRDKLFEMAGRAGVPIKQLYLFPTTRGRLANAFAMQGGTVILTDYLLTHLSEREVIATLAHEIGHLRHGHPRQLAQTLIFSILVSTVAMYLLQSVIEIPWFAMTAVAIVVSTFTTMLTARKFERVADRESVDLTGDAEALITALARLSRLNHVPLDWGAWAEKSLTHPSTLRRARAIAAYGRLPEGRVEELLAALPPASPRFEFEIAPKDQRSFTTLWKARVASNLGLTLLALYATAPAVVIALLRFDHPSVMLRLVALGIAMLAGVGATLAAMDVLTVRPYLDLRKHIVRRLGERGIDVEKTGGRLVGLSPGREPRIYENSGDWDVGELLLMRQRLVFIGDEVKFELSPAQVTAIELGPGLPGWIPAPRVALSWRDEASGVEGALAFRPAEVARLGATAGEARALRERLRAWHEGAPIAHPEAPIEPLGLPPAGAVTSIAPATLIAPRAIVSALIISGFAAAAVSAVLGLRFGLEPGFWDVLLATWAVALFHRAPYWMRARAEVARPAESALDRAA